MTVTTRPTPKSRRSRAATATAAALSAGLLLSACANGETTQTTEAETAQPTVTTTATAEAGTTTEEQTMTQNETSAADSSPTAQASAASMLGQPNLASEQSPPEGEWNLQVTDVRVGAHNGFDRVVFDFEGSGRPGWFVESTATPHAQGSGFPIEYEGDMALNVMIQGTPYPFDLGIPEDQWQQPGPVAGAAESVLGVDFHGIFEANSHYVIRLDGEHPFSVTLLEDPMRLVIDIAH